MRTRYRYVLSRLADIALINFCLGPKAYLAHKARNIPTRRKCKAVVKPTTFLHCDIADAINILTFAQRQEDQSHGGALWTMISRDDMPKAEKLLTEWKNGTFEGHPIHSQQLFVTPDDVIRLRLEGVHVWTFIQRQGEAVFIPVGVGHQVGSVSFNHIITAD